MGLSPTFDKSNLMDLASVDDAKCTFHIVYLLVIILLDRCLSQSKDVITWVAKDVEHVVILKVMYVVSARCV